MASYLAVLFVHLKSNIKDISVLFPWELVRMHLAPIPSYFEPSKHKVQKLVATSTLEKPEFIMVQSGSVIWMQTSKSNFYQTLADLWTPEWP